MADAGGDDGGLAEAVQALGTDQAQDHHRAIAYPALLGVTAAGAGAELVDFVGPLQPQPNQRVIAMDVARTRQDVALFRLHDTQEALQRVLVLFCESEGVLYKQGINQLAAPFVGLGLPQSVCVACLKAMVARFLPHTFHDSDFVGLQCVFRLLRLMLLFHAPDLCRALDQHAIIPELYATPWFLTLFAHNHPLPVVFALWDHYVSASDGLCHFFVVLALVVEHTQALRALTPDSLPEVLSAMRVRSVDHAVALVAKGEALAAATPQSFKLHLKAVVFGAHGQRAVDERALAHLESLVCLPVAAEEATANALQCDGGGGPAAERGAAAFVLVDCRPRVLFDAFHPPTALHADPVILLDVERLERFIIDGMERFWSCRVCLYSSGNEEIRLQAHEDTASRTLMMFALHFLQRGFPFVCSVEGGVVALRRCLGPSEGGDGLPVVVGGGEHHAAAAVGEAAAGEALAWRANEILKFPSIAPDGRDLESLPPPAAARQINNNASNSNSNSNARRGGGHRISQWLQQGANGGLGHVRKQMPAAPRFQGLLRSVSNTMSAAVGGRASVPYSPPPFPLGVDLRDQPESAPSNKSNNSDSAMASQCGRAVLSDRLGALLDNLASHYMAASGARDRKEQRVAGLPHFELVSDEEFEWLQGLRDGGGSSQQRTLGLTLREFGGGRAFVQCFECTHAASSAPGSWFRAGARCVLAVSSLALFVLRPGSVAGGEGGEGGEGTPVECVDVWYLGRLAKVSTRKSDPTLLTLKFEQNATDVLRAEAFRFSDGLCDCQAAVTGNFKRVFLGFDYAID